MALQHGPSGRGWKRIAQNRLEPLDSPPAAGTAGEPLPETFIK
jgi:hypothetical protein